MPKTQAAKELQNERLEEMLEDLFFCYPYLIASGLPRPIRQYKLTEKDRLDLFFVSEAGALVVEIKRDICNVKSVQQILRYVEHLSAKHSTVRGVLIGRRLSPRGRALLESNLSSIQFLQLDVDIPSSVSVCRDCRRAYARRLDSCPLCACTQIIL